MKILFLEAVQNFGGARKSTLELANRLKNDGEDVLVVDLWGSCKPFIEELNNLRLDYRIVNKRNSPIILSSGNPFEKFTNYLKYFFISRNEKKVIANCIREFQADLIVVNNSKTLSLLNKSKHYKILFFARGWFLPQSVSYFRKILYRKKVDLFAAVSQATRHAIFAGGFAKLKDIFVCHNAINLNLIDEIRLKHVNMYGEKTHSYIDSGELVLLHCGGFLESKGQLLMLQIAKTLKSRKIHFKLKMVGIVYKGEESQKFYLSVLDFIQNNDLENEVEIILNQNDVLKYFNEMDILLHPSDTEGLPRVVMEAMAFGKPVIGNPVGGMLDYVLNDFTGYLVNHNNIDEYVNAVLDLYYNKDKYSFISRNCYELVKYGFTEESQLNDFRNILKVVKHA